MIKIEICASDVRDKEVILNLFQLYLYDTSVEDPDDLGDDGRYSYSENYFAQYWSEPLWSAHLIRVDGVIAGFVLVEASELIAGAQEFADLFILKRYRRRGVAEHVALRFLLIRQVSWVVVVFNDATEANLFWKKLFLHPQLGFSRHFPDPDGRAAEVYVLEQNNA